MMNGAICSVCGNFELVTRCDVCGSLTCGHCNDQCCGSRGQEASENRRDVWKQRDDKLRAEWDVMNAGTLTIGRL